MTAGRPLRVVQVIDALNVGGAERLVTRFAGAAAGDDRVELSVLTLRPSRTDRLTQELRELGVTVGCVPPKTRRHLADPTMVPRLRQALRPNDVVQCHLGTANILGVLAARAAGRPVISTLHSVELSEGEQGSGTLRRVANDLVLRHAPTCVVAVGAAVKDAHAGRIRTSTEVITNPAPPAKAVTPAERQAARARVGAPAGPVIATVGRLEEPKGHDDLLDAMHRLGEDVSLLVAGDGSLRSELERRATDLGLDGRVRFLGQTDDVRAVLAAADLYVSSSRREGMPMAILEAMSAGLAVVATDVGDVARTVGAAGLVVPPRRADELAHALATVLEDTERRAAMAAESLRLATEEHDEASWFARWSSLWQRLADGATTLRPAPAGSGPGSDTA